MVLFRGLCVLCRWYEGLWCLRVSDDVDYEGFVSAFRPTTLQRLSIAVSEGMPLLLRLPVSHSLGAAFPPSHERIRSTFSS